MAVPTKRAWKLQEFVAHSGNVNCLTFGHKSGRVLATGGEDKQVNMWAVGKPNCIMSLSGHTSPIETVRFGNAEEIVAAGSLSGALKIWDLEATKILRTLTGHKSNIRSLDFHPYGDFVASGSLDTNVKLWDIRRKGCIFTYKGHTNSVNHLRFSPDGRWIVSAGEDSLIKLWDLTAGKLLTDLKDHTGPVNTCEFHPNEFLLASGSSDRTIKFWDLEKMECVSSTDGDSGAVRNIVFHPEGSCIFGGSHDVLKVYDWEPSTCLDSAAVGWNRVADMVTTPTQLFGASFSQSNVSVYVVDLNKIKTVKDQPPSEPVDIPKPTPTPLQSSQGRKTFSSERPATQSSKQAPKEEEEEPSNPTEDPGDDAQSTADVKDPQECREIFQPKSRLASSPSKKLEPFPAPPEDGKRQKPAPAPAPQLRNAPSVVPANRDKPAGVTASDFLPKQAAPAFGKKKAPGMSESEALSAITKGHGSMKSVLNNRNHNLQVVRALWTSGNVKNALDTAVGMNDQAVLVDLLNIMILKSNMWSLDISSGIIPELKNLLNSKYENYVQVSCNSLKLILKNFGPVIKTNIAAPPGMGVDISREERYRKCSKIYNSLMEVRSILDSKHHVSGKLGSTFRELQLLLGTLD